MLRTWSVRLEAMKFTESVRSRQVPDTPSTSAWPPSLPSVPTSRATRVTWSAKEESWPTIVLMVFLSSRISPLTSTVICWERSPFATAVVTSAMLRTWLVRFEAIRFTDSVRSFQVPATLGTSAWPPSLPSVPTSRATLVTWSAKIASVPVISLSVSASSATSPLASTVIFCDRSPSATAVATWAIERTWSVRLEAMKFTDSVRSRQVPDTPSTSAWPPSLPSVPTSRATRVTWSANEESWPTIVFTVFLSSRISPLTSTVICWERSPFATAVVTWAMLRTWLVRLEAIRFTESVRSFQVPATLGTSAWPRSLPSVPTSRATLVTWSAKIASVPVISLSVSASSATSPLASTVIFCVRSPRATAFETWEMLRTWSVRLEAMKFTFSVRSRQVPDTPLTSAWPPSLPSVPTSRATRVTWSANEESWPTIVFTVFLSSRISPLTSTVICCERSPFATAVVTWAMLRTWLVRLEAIRFTESVRSFQVPATLGTSAWPPSLPSVPTSRATLVTWSAKIASVPVISLSVSASSATSPLASTVIFCDRSPSATAVATWAIERTWSVRLEAMKFTDSVRSRQVPETPLTSAWPPSLPSVPTSRATRVTWSAKEESWPTIVFTVFLSSRISPLTSTVICWERSPFATAVVTSAMLRTWLVRLEAIRFTDSVRSFQVPATLGTSAWPPSLPSVPTSRATLVTWSAKIASVPVISLSVSASSATSPLASTVIFCERSPRATAFETWEMLRTWSVRLEAMKFTFSVRSRQVPDTPLTSACPPSLPSVPTSRATRVTWSANEESWPTIVFTVFLSSRISPLTSTVICWERSPFATAVVTWAMLRTWLVRLEAIRFTDSVRSFQVPATLGTSAWPPSLPSVPTSRATLVTWSAKIASVSVISLSVSASSATSPLASTVIFCERSPRATAFETCEMLRTWLVRLEAMKFTDSVRSFQVPATLGTSAWPPSLPSVPTSRATLVTCSAKIASVSVISLSVSARVATSPLASTVIFCERSPRATA